MNAFKTGHLSVLTVDTYRSGKVFKFDTFRFSALYFFRIGRHFLFGPPVNHRYILSSKAFNHTGSVYGHVAAADNNHPIAGKRTFTQIHICERDTTDGISRREKN